jgi:D-3-phosphoglycerate dehydrogenase
VGKDAIAILYLDQRLDQTIVDTLEATGLFQQVKPLEFDVA